MDTILPGNSYSFLDHGSEMGRLTRSFNWASTSVGDPQYWPQSLRTMISVILNSKFPMFLWWGDDLVQFYNDAYRPSLGNNGKHPLALGQNGKDCWPEIWAVIKPLIDQVREKGEATWNEDQLIPIYRNGHLEDVYWTFSYSPVNDESGKAGGVLVVCNETTEKVMNNLALQENENKLRFAIEATELGTWDYDPFTDRFTANDRLKNWYGLSTTQDINLSDTIAIIGDSDKEKVKAAIDRSLDHNSAGHYDIEYSIIHPETAVEKIVRAKGRAWFNDEKVAYRFNGTLQDVTDEVFIRRAIEEEQERTKLAIEAADLGTYILNLTTDELITSPRLNEIFGIDPSAIHNNFLDCVHGDDLEKRNEAYSEALETGILKYEIRIRLKNDVIRWIKANGKVFKDKKNNPVKILGLVQDITEQKETDTKKDDFIRVVSHELKTPLTSILGYSDLLNDKFSSSEDKESTFLLSKMRNQVLRLKYIIQDLMDVSRIEGNKIRFREDHFDISDLASQIVEEIQMIYPKNNISISSVETAHITADRDRTSQVFTNLLTNAIKYSPDHANIFVKSWLQNGEIICSVQDFGSGIAPEDHSRIFERYYQLTDVNRNNAGLGLGLYISAEIIKRQHGKIWVESEPGKGSTFFFSLPVKKPLN